MSAAVLLLFIAFFVPTVRPDAEGPTRLVNFAYLDAVARIVGTLTLGIGLLCEQSDHAVSREQTREHRWGWRTSGIVLGDPAMRIVGTDVYDVLPGGLFLVHHVDLSVGSDHVRDIGGAHITPMTCTRSGGIP